MSKWRPSKLGSSPRGADSAALRAGAGGVIVSRSPTITSIGHSHPRGLAAGAVATEAQQDPGGGRVVGLEPLGVHPGVGGGGVVGGHRGEGPGRADDRHPVDTPEKGADRVTEAREGHPRRAAPDPPRSGWPARWCAGPGRPPRRSARHVAATQITCPPLSEDPQSAILVLIDPIEPPGEGERRQPVLDAGGRCRSAGGAPRWTLRSAGSRRRAPRTRRPRSAPRRRPAAPPCGRRNRAP